MTPEELREAGELFERAWELPEAEQAAWVNAVCADRPAIRERVLRLLEGSRSAEGWLTNAAEPLWLEAATPAPAQDGSAGTDALREDGPGDGMVPSHIGRYRVRRLIAVGGMGAVYEAEQPGTGRRVAIKLVRAAALSQAAASRIEREARILARLRHPGIAEIYQAGTCSVGGVRQPFFVMEYIQGEPLHRYVDQRGCSLEEKLTLIAQVCDALEHAHQRGVIHRDLKPANVLIESVVRDEEGPARGEAGKTPQAKPPGRPRIVDFGVAMFESPEGDVTVHTAPGQLLGTLPYMSPEQLGGSDPSELAFDGVDTRSDVYSIGVMVFELVTGRLPFPARGSGMAHALALLRANSAPPRARQFAPDLPFDVEAIVAKAIERDVARRYQSAADLAADIRRFLSCEPVLARPLTAGYVARRFFRRHRAQVVTTAAVVLLVLAGASLAFVRVSLAEQRAQRQYALTKETADFLINEVIARLEDISGASDVNRLMIERVLTHSQQFLAEHAHDERVLHNHATLLGALGNLEEEQGRHAEAALHLGEALRLRERLVELNPTHANRMQHSIALVRSGNASELAGDLVGAERTYRRALEIDASLAQTSTECRRSLDNLGHSYERIAILLRKQPGFESEVRELLRRRLDIAQELVRRYPHSPESLVSACSAYAQISTLEMAHGRTSEARRHADSAVAFANLLIEQSPDRVSWTRYAFAAFRISAELVAEVGDPAEAIELYHQAQRLAARQLVEQPRSLWPREAARWAQERIRSLSPADVKEDFEGIEGREVGRTPRSTEPGPRG